MSINTNLHVLYKNPDRDHPGVKNKKWGEYRRQWNENQKNNFVSNFPLFLDLDISSGCNLKCPTCIQTLNKQKLELMPTKLFERIIQEAQEGGCFGFKCHTIGRGEPLLNPNLPYFIEYGKYSNMIDIRVNTNGTLLDFDLSLDLLQAGLDMIIFSVDGIDDEYNKSRPGIRFDELLYKIRNFVNLRNLGKFGTFIRVQSINFPYINFDRYVEFWKELVDEVTIVDFKDMNNRSLNLQGNWKCPQPWQRMSVLSNGEILPCNHDDRLLSDLGNVDIRSLESAWLSNSNELLRYYHNKMNAHEVDYCNGCFLRTSEIMKERSTNDSSNCNR
jgi:radical SAM protein with 4Fe4S-binding SPASM domain